LLASIRDYQRHRRLRRKLAVLRRCCAGAARPSRADIPINARIGGGLLIPHPNGIVIHPDAQIGPNCLIFQQVTIGVANGIPPIGGHVDIGPGAKVLRAFTIGDPARIGANAVVLSDVTEGSTVVGIPAHAVAT